MPITNRLSLETARALAKSPAQIPGVSPELVELIEEAHKLEAGLSDRERNRERAASAEQAILDFHAHTPGDIAAKLAFMIAALDGNLEEDVAGVVLADAMRLAQQAAKRLAAEKGGAA